jgi:hypothetical protein
VNSYIHVIYIYIYGSFYNTHTIFMGMVPTQLVLSNVMYLPSYVILVLFNVMLVLYDFLYILSLNNK